MPKQRNTVTALVVNWRIGLSHTQRHLDTQESHTKSFYHPLSLVAVSYLSRRGHGLFIQVRTCNSWQTVGNFHAGSQSHCLSIKGHVYQNIIPLKHQYHSFFAWCKPYITSTPLTHHYLCGDYELHVKSRLIFNSLTFLAATVLISGFDT